MLLIIIRNIIFFKLIFKDKHCINILTTSLKIYFKKVKRKIIMNVIE